MRMDESCSHFSVTSIIEGVLRQHGDSGSRGCDLESRISEEAVLKRCEAAIWLRKIVGAAVARDVPVQPSEEEFRLSLRSGLVLCHLLNKIQPGSIPKVVESYYCDLKAASDGAALSAFQYFENVRNFLVAVKELGLPTFDASDLEQHGSSSRIANCILSLKSYSERKQTGAQRTTWKSKMNRDLFSNSSSSSPSLPSSPLEGSSHMSMLVRALLVERRAEQVPTLVESILTKLATELDKQITPRNERSRKTRSTSFRDTIVKTNKEDEEEEDDEDKKRRLVLYEKHQKDIQELKRNFETVKTGMKCMQEQLMEEMGNAGKQIQGLAYAASHYHRVLEENRKLYNQVQDLKGNIRVYCRVRPFLSGGEPNNFIHRIEPDKITINTTGRAHKSFRFNRVFGPDATQEEVFSDTQSLIRSVLDGYNVCIFAYGQTGSGKTHTMSGPREITRESMGVNYRTLRDLFLETERRKHAIIYDITVQMIEIYNEQVRDLLNDGSSSRRLHIHNGSQTGVNVPEANLVPVRSTADVLHLMTLGQRNRAVGSTALNIRSSRSHSCLTVHVRGKDVVSGTELRGCIHLVDLAGSERVNRSEATGDRLKEAQHINRSLSALGDVIASLARKNAHVPYRNSKLTQMLQDSLGGQAKTMMFVHVSPDADAAGETISTLKFAERVASVELGSARVNETAADVKDLKEQIVRLQGGDHVPKPLGPELDNSPPWPPLMPAADVDDGDCISSGWVDKVIVNNPPADPLFTDCFADQNAVSPENVFSTPQYQPAGHSSESLFCEYVDHQKVSSSTMMTKSGRRNGQSPVGPPSRKKTPTTARAFQRVGKRGTP